MAHPLVWPGKYFFYPIGNTSAVCLTRDLPPEEDASILLLGCGDPRHILYTIFSEPDHSSRYLDFTCCDIDPGILEHHLEHFYHMFLDDDSHSVLRTHIALWCTSPYGHTLVELRHHWSLYDLMQDLPPKRLTEVREAFNHVFDQLLSSGTVMTSARSKQAKYYWKTGTTFSAAAPARLLNPTFAYSLAGEGCAVHYASDPMVMFHPAPLFGNSKGNISPAQLVESARSEFSEWVSGSPAVCIRFGLAEAMAFCQTLTGHRESGSLGLGIPIAQYKTQLLRLCRALSTFNVIETSNLIDHIGLLNILVAMVPLLSHRLNSVLYTEQLLFRGKDATKDNIGTVGMLLDLCPINYLSGFTSRSNTHEQFHQATTWKRPSSCDGDVVLRGGFPTLLFDIYHAMFEQEDAMTFWKLNHVNTLKSIVSSNMVHHMCQGFAMLLKLWLEGWVHTMDYYKLGNIPRIGPFSGWYSISPIVQVILSVPRHRTIAFKTIWSHNIFSTVNVAFGRVISIGSKADPCMILEEDPDGWKGSLPLVVSFCILAMLLTNIEPPTSLRICLSVRSMPGTALLIPHLGMELQIFSANLMDEEHVHVIPDSTELSLRPSYDFEEPSRPFLSPNSTLRHQIGTQNCVLAELDEQCELVQSLATKVTIEDTGVQRDFGSSGAVPQFTQLSPCCMLLTVTGRAQDVTSKLRLAHKSLYIEIVVPTAGLFLKPDGMKLNPFPVTGAGVELCSWNIHQLELAWLPVLDPKAPELEQWLNPHIGSSLSTRERTMRKKHRPDALMFVKDTIHSIFVRSTGIQGNRLFRVISLQDERTKNCDTVFFISDVRYDLCSHTMVCDGYVLPLSRSVMSEIKDHFGQLVHGGDMIDINIFEGEMQAWKQLIPAFVEHCRTWTHQEGCEYLKAQQVPLTTDMEVDPLCSCGRGKDVDARLRTVGRNPAMHKCSVCRGPGQPKLKACTGCMKVRYCSQACQKKDWPRHKGQCKA
ncbi:hypothetical protein C8Q79DRAFT_1002903 [Trametes meyenii]|nr:hypothetical protein C8Q79DRAFT_1002903 [Trametes meyenii]